MASGLQRALLQAAAGPGSAGAPGNIWRTRCSLTSSQSLDAVRDCDPASLPGLIGALEQAKAEAWGRLSTPVAPPDPEAKAQPERLLTPEEAASIAQVPVRRLYGWARGQCWARRPTSRCLRIGETSFRRWLAMRG